MKTYMDSLVGYIDNITGIQDQKNVKFTINKRMNKRYSHLSNFLLKHGTAFCASTLRLSLACLNMYKFSVICVAYVARFLKSFLEKVS